MGYGCTISSSLNGSTHHGYSSPRLIHQLWQYFRTTLMFRLAFLTSSAPRINVSAVDQGYLGVHIYICTYYSTSLEGRYQMPDGAQDCYTLYPFGMGLLGFCADLAAFCTLITPQILANRLSWGISTHLANIVVHLNCEKSN